MTRNNFLKSIGVLLGVAVAAPKFGSIGNGYLPSIKKYGNRELKNWEGGEGKIEKGDWKEFERVRQYPLTEEECYRQGWVINEMPEGNYVFEMYPQNV